MPPDEATPAVPTAPEPSTPSTPASTPEPSSAPPQGAEFSGLGEDFDDEVEVNLDATGGIVPPVEAAPEPTPAEPAPPAPAPAQAKPVEPPKPVAAQPPPEGPKETPAAPATPPSEPQTLVAQLGQHRLEIMDELAKTRFRWDEGEKKQFTDDLEKDASQALVDWVPKLMARMYYESATMALNHISQFTPVLINNFTRLMEQQKTAEGEFFKQFPQLSKDKHWNDILQFSGVFGKQPGITQADLLAMVGAAVMAKNKMSLAAPAPGGQPPRKPSTPPFVPAQAGGSPARVVTEPESPYAGLGGHYDED